MYVSPDADTDELVQAARAFLANQGMDPLAFVLVVDRSGQWRSVHDPDGQVVASEEEEGKFAEMTATWWVRETSSRCVRQKVGTFVTHIHFD
jgi:hypothetical protein